jgi:hypothetical protein
MMTTMLPRPFASSKFKHFFFELTKFLLVTERKGREFRYFLKKEIEKRERRKPKERPILMTLAQLNSDQLRIGFESKRGSQIVGQHASNVGTDQNQDA